MNRQISFAELSSALRSLRLGLGAGEDGIPYDLLKNGGRALKLSLWQLFCVIWGRVEVPRDWRRGIITLLHKSGSKHDPANYRGITLLSCTYKLLASILNKRLMTFCERINTIAPEQAGFRAGRSCAEQLFALTEILRLRKSKHLPTVCCFIDISKAYDRIDRELLWLSLRRHGIQGRMLEFLRTVYTSTDSAVCIDGYLTEFFSVSLGVRQGCVLSPSLFLIFINGLVAAINSAGLGIRVNAHLLLVCLLFADDLVLLAESTEQLQRLLDTVVAPYLEEWRMKINLDKTKVVVCGGRRRTVHEVSWRGIPIDRQTSYKYLGVDVSHDLRWTTFKTNALSKATAIVMSIWGSGRHHNMSVRAQVQLWKSLVIPILLYSCQVWCDVEWGDAEVLQHRVAKYILGISTSSPNAAVLNELGLTTLKTRADEQRLRFWASLLNLDDAIPAKFIFINARNQFNSTIRINPLTTQPSSSRSRALTTLKTRSWMVYTYQLLNELQLSHYWNSCSVDPVMWRTTVRAALKKREDAAWLECVNNNARLDVYRRIMANRWHRIALYLTLPIDYQARRILTMLRIGSSRLRVHEGRYLNGFLPRDLRVCQLCLSAVEDEHHFMLVCPFFAVQRRCMLERCRVVMSPDCRDWVNLNDHSKLAMILRLSAKHRDAFDEILKFVRISLYRRKQLLLPLQLL